MNAEFSSRNSSKSVFSFFPIVETSLLGDKARDHFLLRVTGADRLDFYFVILYWFFCLAKL
jgi:hypothetical protein